MSIQTFQETELDGVGREGSGGGWSFRALNRASPSDTERVQPTPDTLVSAPLCSLCSKRLQTSCTGAVNLGGGFDTQRKGGKEGKKEKRHRTEQGCVRCDGWTYWFWLSGHVGRRQVGFPGGLTRGAGVY